jgi:hypothetical protein
MDALGIDFLRAELRSRRRDSLINREELAMRLRKQQAGLGMLGWLIVLAIASFALTCFLRVGPVYLEYWQTKKILDQVVASPQAKTMSSDALLGSIEKQFNVNDIEAIKRKDIKITEVRGSRELNANYEKRVPLIANIDVVVKFDKLVYKLSSAE